MPAIMGIAKRVRNRTLIRAFTDKPVSKTIIQSVLDVARWAPSGGNTQPWEVAVVAGAKKDLIGKKMLEAYRAGDKGNPDYEYYAKRMPEPYLSRQFACGMALYKSLGIMRHDKKSRMQHWEKNYRAFDAPVQIFIFVDAALEKGSWVDCGMFTQSIMLAAQEFELDTCPQAAVADYPQIVREILGIPSEKQLICGIALGYHPKSNESVNNYRTERESVDKFTQWHGI